MTEVSFQNPESESKTTASNSNKLKWKKAKEQLSSTNNSDKFSNLVDTMMHSKSHDLFSASNKKDEKSHLVSKSQTFESNSKTLFLDPKLVIKLQ